MPLLSMTYCPLMRGLVVGLVVGLCALGLGASPAVADNGVSGSVSTAAAAVANPGCVDIPVDYSINFPSGVNGWDLTIGVYRADGTQAGTTFLDNTSDAVFGTVAITVCGIEGGTSTIRASGFYGLASEPYASHRYSLPDGTYDVPLADSRTRLRRSGTHGVTVIVTDARSDNFVATRHAKVLLQQRVGKHWRTLPRGRITTDRFGRARYFLPRNRGDGCATVRAKTKATSNYEASTSNRTRICR